MVSFVLKHWLATLIAPPLVLFLFACFEDGFVDFTMILDDFGILLIIFFFIFLLSLPTYIFMISMAYFIDKEERSVIQKKIILFVVSFIGIIVTFEIIISGSSYKFVGFYVLTSFLSTIIFKINHQSLSK